MFVKKTHKKAKKQAFANKQINNSNLYRKKTSILANNNVEAFDNSIASKALRALIVFKTLRALKTLCKILTLPLVLIKLIRLSKGKVKVTPNVVKSTP